MLRRILPFAAALAIAAPAAAFAATPASSGPSPLLQQVDWQGEHDGDHGSPPPWLWNNGHHDHDRWPDHDRHDRDHRGHWVPAHVEWHHHHRVWIPGHWERT